MSFMAALTAAKMGGGGGGGGPMSSATSSADMGDDYSRKVFQGVTFNKPKASSGGADDTIKWVVIGIAVIAAAKIFKG